MPVTKGPPLQHTNQRWAPCQTFGSLGTEIYKLSFQIFIKIWIWLEGFYIYSSVHKFLKMKAV